MNTKRLKLATQTETQGTTQGYKTNVCKCNAKNKFKLICESDLTNILIVSFLSIRGN